MKPSANLYTDANIGPSTTSCDNVEVVCTWHYPKKHCPPIEPGRMPLQSYQLYPKNLSWDSNLCQVYLSTLYNSSIAIFSPSTFDLTVLSIPNQTLSPNFHIAGSIFDKHSSLLLSVVTNALAFRSRGQNILGDNILNKYDAQRRNTWVNGTFPGTILKVDKTGRNITECTLLIMDAGKGEIFHFDLRQKKVSPTEYERKVLLVSDQSRRVVVLRSRDAKWKTGEYLGLVRSDATLPLGGLTAAVSQVEDRIYMLPNWFFQPKGRRDAGRESKYFFSLVDITEQVDELLK
ncbi:tri14-like protein [Podospora australis]|uniref:Tri14-like protein n=1 Tax=Podospora australis TaxID=1536484 RepID=A0AAN7AE05_9PEZI|nr:tri14-like protein [Podospora australis]